MFEIKIRMMNEEMAEKLLAPLKLGVPAFSETGTHVYLQDETLTRKIKEVEGAFTYVVAKRHGPGFEYTAEALTPDQREDVIAQYPPQTTLTIHRTGWEKDGVRIELDRIDGLGVFLELHENDFERLKIMARQIGFSEQHYLTRTYDELT